MNESGAESTAMVVTSTTPTQEELEKYPWRRYRTDQEHEALKRQIIREEQIEWLTYGMGFVALVALLVWFIPLKIWVALGALVVARIFLS